MAQVDPYEERQSKMGSVKYTREEDHIPADAQKGAAGSIDVTPFVGIWVNTNAKSKGISRVVVDRAGDGLTVDVFGACDGSPRDWGEVKVDFVYAKSAGSQEPMAFSARYDFGFMETRLEANLSLGLLVIAGLNKFKDDSGRSNYFSREFFHR
jgi:hypothetical protein